MQETDQPNAAHKSIPVTVVTGFLGSGKTTLINHILTRPHGRKIAVIVNEFGEIGIDGQLVVQDGEEQVVEFNNGCICCTVRDDLTKALTALSERTELDAVLIETTGLADPAPVAAVFFVVKPLRRRFHLDALITVADAAHLEGNLADSAEAQEQLGFADIVLLNKCDLVSAQLQEHLTQVIHHHNPLARVYPTRHGQIDLALILGVKAFALEAKLAVDPSFLDDQTHEHDASVGSLAIRDDRPLDLNKFMVWMNSLLQTPGVQIYRSKGLFYVRGFRERMLFQSVRMLTSLQRGRPWQPDEQQRNEFVVIGRNLDSRAVAQGFASCIVGARAGRANLNTA